MNGHSRQSPVAIATPPQATALAQTQQPPDGIGGGFEETAQHRGGGGGAADNNAPQAQHQQQHQQTQSHQYAQRYQPHREGDSSVPRATIQLPASTTLMRSDIPATQEMYGPPAGAGGGMPHAAAAYQQTAGIYPQGQATPIYPSIQQQYFFNPTTGQYYGTAVPGAYMTAGVQQALLMTPQQHQHAYHQHQQQMLAAQHMAVAQQSHPQGPMPMPNHHSAAGVPMTSVSNMSQMPPVSVISGAGAISAAAVAQQSSTLAAVSAAHGIVPTGTAHLQSANVVVTSSGGGQTIPPQQQLQREKRVLKFVDPNTQKELDLSSGSANEPKRKPKLIMPIMADGKEKGTAEETADKTLQAKEFLKKVTERMNFGAAGDLKSSEGNAGEPSVTPPLSMPITREVMEQHNQSEQQHQQTDSAATDWVHKMPQRVVYGGGQDMQIVTDQQQLPKNDQQQQQQQQQHVTGTVANVVVQQPVHHQTQLTTTTSPTSIAAEQQQVVVVHASPPPGAQLHIVPQQRLSPGPRLRSLLDMNVENPQKAMVEQQIEQMEHPQQQQQLQQQLQHIVPKIVGAVDGLPEELPPLVVSPAPEGDEDEEGAPRAATADTIGGGSSRKGSQNELNGDEDLSSDRLTPTLDEGEPQPLTEERIRELEDQMQQMEMRDENNDPSECVYSRKFLFFIRKVTLALKTVNCPRSEEELEELGLSRRGMPIVPAFSMGGKTKRFDNASSDQFKTPWQQAGGGGGGPMNQFGTGSGGRFTTSRPPYAGRHSDNKLKQKKGPIARQSLDQRPLKLSQVSSQQVPELQRSANAWKPKREERFDMEAPARDEEEVKYEKLCKEVRGLLNKITPSTYKELSEEFIQYKIHEDPRLLEVIIDLIFDKAVEEPHFCPLYSDLCKRQVEEEKLAMADKPTEKSFRSEMIQKCQTTFTASNKFDEKIIELKKKMDELDEADEKGRAQVEDEIEMRRSKEKRRLLGIIRFISQLYRHQLLIDKIINWCAVELIKRYEVTKDEVYIEYAVELLETVGKVYEKRQQEMQKQHVSDQQKDSFSLDKIFTHLTTLKKEMSNRIRFAILELEDLRKSNWMPRGGEKGPKTIEEVREEVEKEQQENEMERIEHEKQKDKDKMHQQTSRKGGARPSYGGRSSADRRPTAVQNANSLLSTSRAESRISQLSKLREVDNFGGGLGGARKPWGGHPRDRTPQKEDSLGPTSATGDAAGGGGTATASDTAWRSASRGGTDSPKDNTGGSGQQGGAD